MVWDAGAPAAGSLWAGPTIGFALLDVAALGWPAGMEVLKVTGPSAVRPGVAGSKLGLSGCSVLPGCDLLLGGRIGTARGPGLPGSCEPAAALLLLADAKSGLSGFTAALGCAAGSELPWDEGGRIGTARGPGLPGSCELAGAQLLVLGFRAELDCSAGSKLR